jgi:integrase
MATARITLKTIEALQPGQTLWDESLKGFGVRRQRKAPVYVVKYRESGRQRFVTIGAHGERWTPTTAREQALRILAAPRTAGTTADDPQSFGWLAATYMARHSALQKKPRSQAEDRRNLELHILPALGALPIQAVTRDVVSRFHTSRQAQPANANRCMALISHIFTKAETWGLTERGTNPCRGLDRYREVARERFLSSEEIARLGKVLAQEEQDALAGRADWRADAVIRLLLYTGARLSEILTLQWSFIDWAGGFARLPDSKTGAKSIALPAPALAVLRAVRAQQGHAGGKFVFPGKKTGTWFTGIQKPWQRIRAKAALEDIRIHDLRHSFASMAVANGESLYLVGSVLGHRQAATTQRYAHVAMTPVLEVAGRIASRIADLIGGHDVGT